ncbi:alcohol dehydrogenase catalytic domain-containing protein [Nostoc sp. LEGE 06077]|uniref:alcohol dehydrogenase catalytic domain-containing protein n=1 Tax=Nostocales TaxID=1161 RepID=UPI000BBBB467|nr:MULTISPECIES: alcohol dehydrogenase catalytic domain-containing protein [Nostocales]MBE9206161.1 alcohol dehydrogenase catalytic domain-containing protein [Nostoc sp. LEGE 06077]MDM9384636.1 alcohol dehydrogenase catalytic domain-containing protein [Chlorogloeopsis sp. ULAP01]
MRLFRLSCDRVLAPFAFSDATCEFCHKGIHTACVHGGFWGTINDGELLSAFEGKKRSRR